MRFTSLIASFKREHDFFFLFLQSICFTNFPTQAAELTEYGKKKFKYCPLYAATIERELTIRIAFQKDGSQKGQYAKSH